MTVLFDKAWNFMLSCFNYVKSFFIPEYTQGSKDNNTNTNTQATQPISLPQERIQLDKTQLLIGPQKILGKGGFGSVFQYMLNGVPVAVKKANSPQSNEEQRHETKMLVKAGAHRNIIRLISSFEFNRNAYIVLELMGGTVDQLLEQFPLLTIKTKLSIALQLASGLAYLHNLTGKKFKREAILHQDLKTSNLLVEKLEDNPANVVKIADFGLAREVNQVVLPLVGSVKSKLLNGQGGGTPQFVAPEVIASYAKSNGNCSELKSDVFSSGIILWHLATNSVPNRTAEEICKGEFKEFTKDKIPAGQASTKSITSKPVYLYPRSTIFGPVINKCIKIKPRDRSSAAEMLTSLQAL